MGLNPMPNKRQSRRRKWILKPRLTYKQILAWADAHHKRTGDWPASTSGRIVDARDNSWGGVSSALTAGLRGLPGGSSLARLLKKHRGRFNVREQEPLTFQKILKWADTYRERTGAWPTCERGPVQGEPHEHWKAIESALSNGYRGLPGGYTLSRLLDDYRPERALTEDRILSWADAHFARNGKWPIEDGGPIPEATGEKWSNVSQALASGRRGLPGGHSLAGLLELRRGHRNTANLPRLTVKQILRWSDDHRRRAGRWPTLESGPIPETRGEKWFNIDAALRQGQRGLAGGSSIARLLDKHRGVRNVRYPPRLTHQKILRWADAHHRRTGKWPRTTSGPLKENQDEKWSAIDGALSDGQRGLPGGYTLAGLLRDRRGALNPTHRPPLTIGNILRWADAHHKRTGRWPNCESGPVVGAPGEVWRRISRCLSMGERGLKGGSSLARCLGTQRGVRSQGHLPRLTIGRILRWADRHHRRTGNWPTAQSGPIEGMPGEKWLTVDAALRAGSRGLSSESSLSQLLDKHGRIRRYARRARAASIACIRSTASR